MGYDDGGFAVIAVDDLMPAVMGVSAARHSNGSNPNWMHVAKHPGFAKC